MGAAEAQFNSPVQPRRTTTQVKIRYASAATRSEPVPSPEQSDALPDGEVERMLAAARRVIEELPFFWVVTPGADGGANARIVNAQPGRAGEDFWTRWFLTPPNGRKAAEIRGA